MWIFSIFFCLLQLAFQRGFITAEERARVFGVMRSLGLALWHEVCTLDVLMQVLLTLHCLVWCLKTANFVWSLLVLQAVNTHPCAMLYLAWYTAVL